MFLKHKYNQLFSHGLKMVLAWLKSAARFTRALISDAVVFIFSIPAALGLVKWAPANGEVGFNGRLVAGVIEGACHLFYLTSFILILVLVDD
jgi:hypothetical protein